MKIVAPIRQLDEIAALARAGADELYCGVTPREWAERFGGASANRRPGGNLPRGTVTPAPPLRAGISTAFPDVPTVTPAPPARPPHGRPPVPWQTASGGGSWRASSRASPPAISTCRR